MDNIEIQGRIIRSVDGDRHHMQVNPDIWNSAGIDVITSIWNSLRLPVGDHMQDVVTHINL